MTHLSLPGNQHQMVPERWQFVEGVREKKMLICMPLPSAARFAFSFAQETQSISSWQSIEKCFPRDTNL